MKWGPTKTRSWISILPVSCSLQDFILSISFLQKAYTHSPSVCFFTDWLQSKTKQKLASVLKNNVMWSISSHFLPHFDMVWWRKSAGSCLWVLNARWKEVAAARGQLPSVVVHRTCEAAGHTHHCVCPRVLARKYTGVWDLGFCCSGCGKWDRKEEGEERECGEKYSFI